VEVGESKLDKDNLSEIEDIVSVCAGLVIIDEESNVIRLVYYTTQEYFKQMQKSWLSNAETSIAVTCLTYMSFDVFTEGYCASARELESRLQLFPLIDYAACYLGHYLRGELKRKLKSQILTFLKHKSSLLSFTQVVHVLEKNFPMHYRSFLKSITGLHFAASYGLKHIANSLLKKRPCDITIKNDHMKTPLHIAAESGHKPVVRLLLEKGANIEAKNRDSRTALYTTAIFGHELVAQVLLQNSADHSSKDVEGWTAIHLAAQRGDKAIVLLLLKSNVNINAEDYAGRTVFQSAVQECEEVSMLLLEKRADIHRGYDNNQTALLDTAKYRHWSLLRDLLKAGMNINAKIEEEYDCEIFGQTALQIAAGVGNIKIIEVLLSEEAIAHVTSDNGFNALHMAALREHTKVMQLLLERTTININTKTNAHNYKEYSKKIPLY
jgi:ankyrin repeat protein